MEPGTRAKRAAVIVKDSAVRSARWLGRGLAVVGRRGFGMARDSVRAMDRRFRRREEKRPDQVMTSGFPMARFDFHGEFHFLQPSEAKQSFRRELARSHAQLAEQLRAEEEELSRVAARVVRLQSLLRAQQSLLLEATRGHEADRASLNAPFQPLVGVGSRSGREAESPDLFRPN